MEKNLKVFNGETEMQKKILFLGGSYGQLPAIIEANKRGLYTILCDYLPDNPGRALVDQYYEVSTTDKFAVLDIAKKHEIDAVLAYASDPAAATQAYVSEMLDLPGNSEKSVSLLSNKHAFRKFQHDNRFNAPVFKSFSADHLSDLDQLDISFPVLVKPVDASDSKGVFKVETLKQLQDKADIALSFSKSGNIIVEEYIGAETATLHGDAFFLNGEMIFCLLGNKVCDYISDPSKPVATMFPSVCSKPLISNVESDIESVVSLSGFKNGPVNIEVRVDKEQRIFVMEIGPRSGGVLAPQAIYHCCGVDMMQKTLDFVLNQSVSISCNRKSPTLRYSLHSSKSGVFKGFELNHKLRPFVKQEVLFINPGENVQPFSEAGSTLGVLILTFPDFDVANLHLENLYQTVQESVILA